MPVDPDLWFWFVYRPRAPGAEWIVNRMILSDPCLPHIDIDSAWPSQKNAKARQYFKNSPQD